MLANDGKLLKDRSNIGSNVGQKVCENASKRMPKRCQRGTKLAPEGTKMIPKLFPKQPGGQQKCVFDLPEGQQGLKSTKKIKISN